MQRFVVLDEEEYEEINSAVNKSYDEQANADLIENLEKKVKELEDEKIDLLANIEVLTHQCEDLSNQYNACQEVLIEESQNTFIDLSEQEKEDLKNIGNYAIKWMQMKSSMFSVDDRRKVKEFIERITK